MWGKQNRYQERSDPFLLFQWDIERAIIRASAYGRSGDVSMSSAYICALILCYLLGVSTAVTVTWCVWRRHPPPDVTSVEFERRRISRELHDTVGHGLLVIVMHARRLAVTAPAAHAVAGAIDQVAQSTLRDLREMVGVLRAGRPAAVQVVAPLSARAGELVRALPPDGLDVDLRVVGGEPELPESLVTTGLRVLQEGLSNAIKHGDGRAIRLLVEFAGDTLVVGVETRGRATRSTGALDRLGCGSGLAGLRERVREAGGVLESGPRPCGGFRLVARIAIAEPAARPAVVMNGALG
jgi:signal transduction histidine kinase